jgi:hypothetical protein
MRDGPKIVVRLSTTDIWAPAQAIARAVSPEEERGGKPLGVICIVVGSLSCRIDGS